MRTQRQQAARAKKLLAAAGWIKKGVLVDYSAVAGGPVTKGECLVTDEPYILLGGHSCVAMIAGVSGVVSVENLTPSPVIGVSEWADGGRRKGGVAMAVEPALPKGRSRWVTNVHKDLQRKFERESGLLLLWGEPQATEAYTVEELAEKGMVGAYTVDPARKAMAKS